MYVGGEGVGRVCVWGGWGCRGPACACACACAFTFVHHIYVFVRAKAYMHVHSSVRVPTSGCLRQLQKDLNTGVAVKLPRRLFGNIYAAGRDRARVVCVSILGFRRISRSENKSAYTYTYRVGLEAKR